jgi:hypothetical protein
VYRDGKGEEERVSQLKWNGSGAAQKGQVVQILHQLTQAVLLAEGAIAVQDGTMLRGIRRKKTHATAKVIKRQRAGDLEGRLRTRRCGPCLVEPTRKQTREGQRMKFEGTQDSSIDRGEILFVGRTR